MAAPRNTHTAEILVARFAPEQVRWMVKTSGWSKDGKFWSRIVPYLDSTSIRSRMDEAFGPLYWSSELTPLEYLGAFGMKCRLTAHLDDGTTLVREDVCQASATEPLKGAATGAQKRAAAQLGIGRYLAECPSFFADIGDNFANFAVHKSKGKGANDKDHSYKWQVPADAMRWLAQAAKPAAPKRKAVPEEPERLPEDRPEDEGPLEPREYDADDRTRPLPGKKGAWGNHAGRPIARVPDRALLQARDGFLRWTEDEALSPDQQASARAALADVEREITHRGTRFRPEVAA